MFIENKHVAEIICPIFLNQRIKNHYKLLDAMLHVTCKMSCIYVLSKLSCITSSQSSKTAQILDKTLHSVSSPHFSSSSSSSMQAIKCVVVGDGAVGESHVVIIIIIIIIIIMLSCHHHHRHHFYHICRQDLSPDQLHHERLP